MRLDKLIEKFHKLNEETENAKFKKGIRRLINLLEQIEEKDISNQEKERIKTSISPYLEKIQTQTDLKLGLKKLRKSLINDFKFVPPNYYLNLGLGIGLALGTALGISLGISFDNGIVFGPMIGSGTGLIGGLIAGMFLDKKKESENRTLKSL